MSYVSQNGTVLPCSLDTCPITFASIKYFPTFGGNLAYLIIFVVILVAQAILGIYFRTWSFLIAMLLGLVAEIVGYAARLEDRVDPFNQQWFIMYLCCLTIGPTFFSAAIYFCLGHVLRFYGNVSRFKPRTYQICFIISDVVAVLMQATGGALSSIATDFSTLHLGIHIMIAGLAWQVASIIVFILVSIDLARRVRRIPKAANERRLSTLRNPSRLTGLYIALTISTICILIRSIYRVIELQDGFQSAVASNEVLFMILEGPMIIIATGLLTVYHPGPILHFNGKSSLDGVDGISLT